MSEPHRPPYVGDGIDGCLRSAIIDLAEADTHPTGSTAWESCLVSAHRWHLQAVDLGANPGPLGVYPIDMDAQENLTRRMGFGPERSI